MSRHPSDSVTAVSLRLVVLLLAGPIPSIYCSDGHKESREPVHIPSLMFMAEEKSIMMSEMQCSRVKWCPCTHTVSGSAPAQ